MENTLTVLDRWFLLGFYGWVRPKKTSVLFRSDPPSAAAHQSAAVAFDVEDGGHCVSRISIGLHKQCADRSACILGKTSTVGA